MMNPKALKILGLKRLLPTKQHQFVAIAFYPLVLGIQIVDAVIGAVCEAGEFFKCTYFGVSYTEGGTTNIAVNGEWLFPEPGQESGGE